jgi:hypothetical protein
MLFKKGAFHDNELGHFTDIHNKNAKLREKLELMRKDVEEAKAKADKEKKNWEQLRKERDFHVTHYHRVEGEKKELAEQIKLLKDKHKLFEQSLQELGKKYDLTMKQKILIKLDKDAKTRQLEAMRTKVQELEQSLGKGAPDKAKVTEQFHHDKVLVVEQGKPTPWPEDARTNPYRGKTLDDFNHEMACSKSMPVFPTFLLLPRSMIRRCRTWRCTRRSLSWRRSATTGPGKCGISRRENGSSPLKVTAIGSEAWTSTQRGRTW